MDVLDRAAFAWNRIVSKDRDFWFLGAMVLSACVAFLPFSREISISNFFVYALLPIVLVFANPKRFREIPGPDSLGLVAAIGLVAGSFLFNWATGLLVGDLTFGLSDYVILVVGVFALFYSIHEKLVRFGAIVLVLARGGTLLLSMASGAIFAGVSGFFVGAVVLLSRLFVSAEIHTGAVAGQIVVGGASHGSSVFIGWACAGLEELILISVVIFVLIDSFSLSRRRTFVWLGIGVAGSVMVNILRMVVLVWIAFERGIQDMLWVHTHLGDVLFLVWIGIFWILFFRWGLPRRNAAGA